MILPDNCQLSKFLSPFAICYTLYRYISWILQHATALMPSLRLNHIHAMPMSWPAQSKEFTVRTAVRLHPTVHRALVTAQISWDIHSWPPGLVAAMVTSRFSGHGLVTRRSWSWSRRDCARASSCCFRISSSRRHFALTHGSVGCLPGFAHGFLVTGSMHPFLQHLYARNPKW